MPDNQTLFDTAHTAVSIGNNLGRLRQPRFFIYPKWLPPKPHRSNSIRHTKISQRPACQN